LVSQKTIALHESTYRLLRRERRAGETFDDVVRRALRPPPKIAEFAGCLASEPPEVWASIERVRREARRKDEERSRRSGSSRSR
jgi:predicted CopG family antitoxin